MLLTALLALAPQARADAPAQPRDHAAIPGGPAVGVWLVDAEGSVAHWLGMKVDGRLLDEPINVVIRVRANSAPAATAALLRAVEGAGFAVLDHHSSGYQGMINGHRFDQLPTEKDCAFSDGTWLLPNNHGRLFGPEPWGAHDFYFIGAFSKEGINPIGKLTGEKWHSYSSFNTARDRFTDRMSRQSGVKRVGVVNLGNRRDGEESTGDHDGNAVLLEIEDAAN
jgi:hypothetical protein